MATPITTIDSLHNDMIHDCQFDYYSKKLATCSSDTTIKVFDVNGDIYHCSATLTVHEGPVWQVAWAHPKFGVLLASCSYDGSVVVQKEVSAGNWTRVYEQKFSDASVNSIAWAPHELGLVLACATSDGKVAILEYKNNMWYDSITSYFQNYSFDNRI
jgi:protein transport protein SEC13